MGYVEESTVGAAGGVASLDGSGLVPVSQLPISTTELTYAGAGAPSSSQGHNGDGYIDYSSGNIYIKSSGSWGNPVSKILVGNAQAAPVGFTPSNPASTNSTSLAMMGIGSKCKYTPTGSGQVLVNVTGAYYTETAAANITLGGRYGTGTAPLHGAAVTGTRYGGSADQIFKQSPLSDPTVVPFALTALLALTENAAYWFDLALSTSLSSGVASIQNISMTLAEFPS
jgi:hypothetical protein